MARVFMKWASVGMVRDSTLSMTFGCKSVTSDRSDSLMICYVMPMRIVCDVRSSMKSEQGTESHSIHDSPDVSSTCARCIFNSVCPIYATLEA